MLISGEPIMNLVKFCLNSSPREVSKGIVKRGQVSGIPPDWGVMKYTIGDVLDLFQVV